MYTFPDASPATVRNDLRILIADAEAVGEKLLSGVLEAVYAAHIDRPDVMERFARVVLEFTEARHAEDLAELESRGN